jgi:hypothetical protein
MRVEWALFFSWRQTFSAALAGKTITASPRRPSMQMSKGRLQGRSRRYFVSRGDAASSNRSQRMKAVDP